MNVFVVYEWFSYEGNSQPIGVFTTQEKAEEFIKELISRDAKVGIGIMPDKYRVYEYDEL